MYLAGISQPLKKAVQALSQVMSLFARQFLSQDSKQMRKGMSEKELLEGLRNFVVVFKEKVEQLDVEARRLIAMHSARAKA